jgi:C-terminal peptidase prc
MLKSLDPYTEYENLMAAQTMQESVNGKYGGVGLVISNARNPLLMKTEKRISSLPSDLINTDKLSSLGVEVADAFEGYAYDAGLRIGDRIISINGADTRTMSIEQVRNLLRGDPDTVVNVMYERDILDETSPTAAVDRIKKVVSEVPLKRSLVRVSDVRLATMLGKVDEGIGYINLSGFNAAAAKDFRTAMLMLRYSSPQDLKGLILDLRGNPGGLLGKWKSIDRFSMLMTCHRRCC